MSRSKSEKRKLAELVAKQRGIKIPSAYGFLRRAEKAKAPKYSGLSEYAKRKVRKFVAGQKRQKVRHPAPVAARRMSFEPGATYTVPIRAEFDFYGNDKRSRTVRVEMTGDDLNAFINAPSESEAMDVLSSLEHPKSAFLRGATVRNLKEFSVEGENYDSGFFR